LLKKNHLERVKDKYNFESKIKCQLEFANFIDIVYKNAPKNSDEKLSINSKHDINKKKIYKNILKDFTLNYYKNEFLSSNHIGFHKIIFWKCNQEEMVLKINYQQN